MSIYQGKSILVTGGTGMIGIPLVKRLIEDGASVRIASLDSADRAHPQAEFIRTNLLEYENCMAACEGMDYVFHLAGIKGSPAMTKEKPASFFVPTILFNTNMMDAARQQGVKRYLFTSTIGVYSPAAVFYEDDVWKTFPSEHDKFAGWAKRMGELQAEAYAIEHDWNRIAIVRPANVYGPYDNFDPNNAMVIPSLIRRALSGEDPFVVWGDGTQVRDFIHADDVARGMMIALEKVPAAPINLGSGVGISIRDLVKTIVGSCGCKSAVEWDTSKPSGDALRLMDTKRARGIGFETRITLEEGIAGTAEWYRNNASAAESRYNVFTENNYV